MKPTTSIATTRELPAASGLASPREVELLGEFSPLDRVVVVHVGRHDEDHDSTAAPACKCPDDTDAPRIRSAMRRIRQKFDVPDALPFPLGRVLSELPPRTDTEQTKL